MILLPEAMQEALTKEAATYQPILKRYGYILLASQPMVATPETGSPAQPPLPKPPGH